MYSLNLTRALGGMYEEGRSMDESSMVQIPFHLFEHLDSSDNSNPEQYQMLMLSEAEDRATTLKSRISNLNVRQTLLTYSFSGAARDTLLLLLSVSNDCWSPHMVACLDATQYNGKHGERGHFRWRVVTKCRSADQSFPDPNMLRKSTVSWIFFLCLRPRVGERSITMRLKLN